jgi:hypothetical protein
MSNVEQKPEESPTWAENGPPVALGSSEPVQPSALVTDKGYGFKQPLPHNEFNWFGRTVMRWIRWLISKVDNHVHDGGSDPKSVAKVDVSDHLNWGTNGRIEIVQDNINDYTIRQNGSANNLRFISPIIQANTLSASNFIASNLIINTGLSTEQESVIKFRDLSEQGQVVPEDVLILDTKAIRCDEIKPKSNILLLDGNVRFDGNTTFDGNINLSNQQTLSINTTEQNPAIQFDEQGVRMAGEPFRIRNNLVGGTTTSAVNVDWWVSAQKIRSKSNATEPFDVDAATINLNGDVNINGNFSIDDLQAQNLTVTENYNLPKFPLEIRPIIEPTYVGIGNTAFTYQLGDATTAVHSSIVSGNPITPVYKANDSQNPLGQYDQILILQLPTLIWGYQIQTIFFKSKLETNITNSYQIRFYRNFSILPQDIANFSFSNNSLNVFEPKIFNVSQFNTFANYIFLPGDLVHIRFDPFALPPPTISIKEIVILISPRIIR